MALKLIKKFILQIFMINIVNSQWNKIICNKNPPEFQFYLITKSKIPIMRDHLSFESLQKKIEKGNKEKDLRDF